MAVDLYYRAAVELEWRRLRPCGERARAANAMLPELCRDIRCRAALI